MKKTLFSLILLWITFSAQAQWTGNTLLNTLVRDSVGTEEATPIAVTRNDGSTYISFFEQNGSGYDLRMQLLDKFGNKMWAPGGLVVSSFPQSTALFRYDMKVDEADNAIVAFQDVRTGGNLNIVTYKIDGLGNFLWGASGIQLIDPLSAEGMAPTIGITGQNNVVIAWNADNGSAKWVAYQKISPAGTTVWPSVHRIIDSTFVKRYSRATMVSIDNDNIMMLYCEETGSGFPPTSKLFAQHFDANGSAVWSAPLAVSTKAIPFFFFPTAVSDGLGGFYVAFNTGHASFPTQTDVYVQHVTASGSVWNATGNVACALPSTQHFVASSHYDATNAAFWILIQITDLGQGQSGVYVQKMDAAGAVQLTPNGTTILPVSANYYLPRDFSITSDGIISVYSTGSNSTSQSLSAMKNSFAGTLLWGGNPVVISSILSGKDDLFAGIFLHDQVVIVWSDSRNDLGVYAQNITNSGQVGVFTSVDDARPANSFALYPNPSTGIINLSIDNPIEDTKVEVVNSLGQLIMTKEISSQTSATLDLSLQSRGLYFIKLQTNSGVVVKKVILE